MMKDRFEIKTFCPDGNDQLYAWVVTPSGLELEIMFQGEEFWEWVEKKEHDQYPDHDGITRWYDNAKEMIENDKGYAHDILREYFNEYIFQHLNEYAHATDK